MSMDDTDHKTTGPGPVEAALAGVREPDRATWERVRADLVRRAGAEGLIDVAVERHDSPLGPILLGATSAGLVRIGLPAEDEDGVLDELARRATASRARGASSTSTSTVPGTRSTSRWTGA
jgi:methylated-DNA-[protein]-cysteine S-methyltransferase